MNKLTLTDFVNYMEMETLVKEGTYFLISLEGTGKGYETIINPMENLEDKLDYYKKAYNEDLTLKAKPDIRIIHYGIIRGDLHLYFASIEKYGRFSNWPYK